MGAARRSLCGGTSRGTAVHCRGSSVRASLPSSHRTAAGANATHPPPRGGLRGRGAGTLWQLEGR